MQVSHLVLTDPTSLPDTPAPLDSPQTLVMVFGTQNRAPCRDTRRALRQAFPQSLPVGCSSSGHFWGTRLVEDDAPLAIVVRFDHTAPKLASTEVLAGESSFEAGARLAQQLPAQDLVGVLVFADGVWVNGSALLRGMASVFPPGLPVSGGLASDGAAFRETWVLAGARCEPGLVAAVGLYGTRVTLTHGSKGGWAPFGPERRITRSEGNVLFELDDQPALALYKEYLGTYASGLPGSALLVPLAVQPPGHPAIVVRTVIGVDEATQSLTFAGDIPQGGQAQLMQASSEMLLDGATCAAFECMADPARAAGVTGLALGVSCVGRRLVLGERVEDELEAVQEAFGPGISLAGFYSNGEISPVMGRNELHNQTMTLTVISEV